MKALLALLLAAAPPVALLAASVDAQRAEGLSGPLEARAALRRALAERDAAEARADRLERAAESARDAAERAARDAAAVAARIQEAEAGIAAAEARLAIVRRQSAALREELGREQQPLVDLTAALQQFSRRPVALAVLRPGSVKDVVYLRAMLDGAVPRVREQTAGLRGTLAESRRLRDRALAAVEALRAEEGRLRQRREELASLEASQRLASRRASGGASREAERALALAEEARDLDGLVAELDRAAALRRRLAALPGPLLRPARPEDTRPVADLAPGPALETAAAPPSPYLLPVTGRTSAGFGSTLESGMASRGVSLIPRAGAQVVAPAEGRVAFAGPYRGYGRIVIIEHPGDWISLVTGLARTDVAVGEELVAGAPLGVARAADPEVTLELRHGGKSVNPLRFVG